MLDHVLGDLLDEHTPCFAPEDLLADARGVPVQEHGPEEVSNSLINLIFLLPEDYLHLFPDNFEMP